MQKINQKGKGKIKGKSQKGKGTGKGANMKGKKKD